MRDRVVGFRWGVCAAGVLRRCLRMRAYDAGRVPGRYEELMRGGWDAEFPAVVLWYRRDGRLRLFDGAHRLRTVGEGELVPVVWVIR